MGQLLIGGEAISFEFDFMENGVRQAYFKYRTVDVNGVFTSNLFQNLQATVSVGPTSLGEIPARVTDAVLMTVSETPVTIPMPDHRVRLILQGTLSWERNIHFGAPVSTFRLDGVWNQG
jgi:hypothetical protein